MSHYPQPLPRAIALAARMHPYPAVYALAATPVGHHISQPMLIVVTRMGDSHAWATTPGLLIGLKLMHAMTANGALLALEVLLPDLPSGVQPRAFYTLLNLSDPADLTLLVLLQKAEQMAVGFGTYDGYLLAVKAISWDESNRQAILDFMAEGVMHNAEVAQAGNLNFEAAVARFDAHYAERLHQQKRPK